MTHPLTRYRCKHKLTIAHVAEKLGVDKSTVSRYEAYRRAPSLDVMRRIIALTEGEVTADDLLDGPCLERPDQSSHEADKVWTQA